MNLLRLDQDLMRLLQQLNSNPISLLQDLPADDKEEEAFPTRWPYSVKKSSRSDSFAAFLPYAVNK